MHFGVEFYYTDCHVDSTGPRGPLLKEERNRDVLLRSRSGPFNENRGLGDLDLGFSSVWILLRVILASGSLLDLLCQGSPNQRVDLGDVHVDQGVQSHGKGQDDGLFI